MAFQGVGFGFRFRDEGLECVVHRVHGVGCWGLEFGVESVQCIGCLVSGFAKQGFIGWNPRSWGFGCRASVF